MWKKTWTFYFNPKDFYEKIYFKGATWRLPPYHPVRLISLLLFLSNIIIVPFGYIKIFIFVKKQNNKHSGLNKVSRISRKHKNLVNIKYNLFQWILETINIIFVVISPKNNFIYLFCMNCGPPILYFMGIAENRKATEEYLKSKIIVFDKLRKKSHVNQNTESDEVHADFGKSHD